MATFMTFTTLTSDIQNYIERGATIADQTVFNQIPRLINAAERKLCQRLKLQGILESLTDPAGLPVGGSVVSKPDRWRETVSMWRGAATVSNSRKPLLPRSYEWCRTYWPDPSVTDASNPPIYYADYDYSHWLICPTPDQTYPIEVLCYMQPTLLDSSNQNNFFSQYTPNALLYGALLEATPFLKNDERIQVWDTMFEREIATLMGQDLQKILDRSAERTRP